MKKQPEKLLRSNRRESQDIIQQHNNNIQKFLTGEAKFSEKNAKILANILCSGYIQRTEKKLVKSMIKALEYQINKGSEEDTHIQLEAIKNKTTYAKSTQKLTTKEFDDNYDYRSETRNHEKPIHKILRQGNIIAQGELSPLIAGIKNYLLQIFHHKIDAKTQTTEKYINMKRWLQYRIDLQSKHKNITHYSCQSNANGNIIAQVIVRNAQKQRDEDHIYNGEKIINTFQDESGKKYTIRDNMDPLHLTNNQNTYTTIVNTMDGGEFPVIGKVCGASTIITNLGRNKKITECIDAIARNEDVGAVVKVENMNHPQLLINGKRKHIPNAIGFNLSPKGYSIKIRDGREIPVQK